MSRRGGHPFFARLYAMVAPGAERRGAAEHRRRLLTGLSGRVLEIGAGAGANFLHYPATVDEVVAIEPERYLRERAEEAAARAPVEISVIDGEAGNLPAEEGSFDAAVSALVLCTVPDQQRALAELFRVIRPGGELRFYEHVIAEAPAAAWIQRLGDRMLWPRIAGGCHLARDTQSAIERAGFQIRRCERFEFRFVPLLPPDPHILGVGVRPTAQ